MVLVGVVQGVEVERLDVVVWVYVVGFDHVCDCLFDRVVSGGVVDVVVVVVVFVGAWVELGFDVEVDLFGVLLFFCCVWGVFVGVCFVVVDVEVDEVEQLLCRWVDVWIR